MNRSELPRLILRADGNPRIGLGHVMRLLALADALRGQFGCVFAIQEPAAELRARLAESCDEVVEVPPMPYDGEPAWLHQHLLQPDDVLVLDGYGFELTYQEAVRRAVRRLVCLDDLHAFPFEADVVLNPAGGVTRRDYELRQPHARVLAGPAIAPLRSAFRHPTRPVAAPAGMVLVCLGGADPTQQSQNIAAQLLALAPVSRVHLVVGSAYAGWESLVRWTADQPRLNLHRNLSADALARLMQECDTAVCSPSTVSYEYCAVGGGLLFVQPTAANQHDLDHFLRAAGLALPYHAAANVLTSPEAARIRQRLRVAQHCCFDGLAPVRLRQVFTALLLPDVPLRLRPATAADSDLLFEWANDPVVRRHSFNPALVPLADHQTWFAARLADPQHLLLIAEHLPDGRPMGLIRFAMAEDDATLSYQLAAEFRGRGLAAPLLVAGADAVARQFPAVRRVVGHVQPGNAASVKAFARAGFSSAEPTNPASITFVWHTLGH